MRAQAAQSAESQQDQGRGPVDGTVSGAGGFLLKDVTPEHLVAAITRRLVERFAGRDPAKLGLPDRVQAVIV